MECTVDYARYPVNIEMYSPTLSRSKIEEANDEMVRSGHHNDK